MLKAINTKILLAILAALTTIGGLLVHQNRVHEEAAASAAKAAAILQQQQKADEDAKKHDAEVTAKIEQNRKQHSSFAGHESKTWKTYIP